jgi:hypothetical protein
MKYAISFAVLILWSGFAFSQESAIADETPASEQATDKVETDSAAKAEEEKREFEPPPGFKTKKRGKFTVYCIQDATIGTRFKTERCYDEAQMREYLLALEIQKRDIDRIRSTCVTAAVCSPQ